METVGTCKLIHTRFTECNHVAIACLLCIIFPLLKHTAPGPPKGLKVANRTCHSITFQWSRPDDTGRLDITGYEILHNGASVANITGTVYTLKGLKPDTMQTIRVRARNAIGPSVLKRTQTAATEGRGIIHTIIVLTLSLYCVSHNIMYICARGTSTLLPSQINH